MYKTPVIIPPFRAKQDTSALRRFPVRPEGDYFLTAVMTAVITGICIDATVIICIATVIIEKLFTTRSREGPWKWTERSTALRRAME